MPDQKLFDELNSAQRKAVCYKNGPLLILAGAGSGKTKVLTYRIAHLIQNKVPPQNILALTFTNKAAGEMKERIHNLLREEKVPEGETPWIGTFHSLGAWILRNESKHLNIKRHFTILDGEDSLSLIKESMKELKIDPKQFRPSRIRGLISQKKESLIKLEDYLEEAEDYFPKILAGVWELYEDKLKKSDALDFDDLLVKTVRLFEKNPELLKKYQTLWKFINIDEYQDTDHVQYRLANMLAENHSNICVVGDVDQSIYSFRGADFQNILNFEKDWPGAVVITLEENYRSTKPILDAANKVIEKNVFRKPKNLFTKKGGGDMLDVFVARTETDEAEFIALKIQELTENGVSPSSIAVLFRTNSQSRILEEKFLALSLPYHVVGVRFYHRKEVKDVLAYVRASLNPKDSLNIKRIINRPPRGIGKTLTLRYLAGVELKNKEAEKVDSFNTLLSSIKSEFETTTSSKALLSLLKKTQYMSLFDPSSEEDAMRLGNIKELVSLSRRFDHTPAPQGILTLLEEAALMSDQDTMSKEKTRTPLSTVHGAKGLEFDYVFISGMEDGLFPHLAMGQEDEKLRLEEERRLFYVALTRARKKLFLSLALFRMVFGDKQVNAPSRFLNDIPVELIKNTSEENIIELL